MKFDFAGVDSHTSTLGTIIGNMETNLGEIQALKDKLLTDFQGAASTGYETVMADLQRKIDGYNTTLQSVKTAIVNTSGSSGLMKETDQNQGNRFLQHM